LEDTSAYYTPNDLDAGFRKSIAVQPRVIKQNRGCSGEGVWVVKLKDASSYCEKYGARKCSDKEVLILQEANDNHIEEHTVGEFIEFCAKGRTKKSGTWASSGSGNYFAGGRAAGGHLVDQRFCPTVSNGVLRYIMIGNQCARIVHRKPREGTFSAVDGEGLVCNYYSPNEAKFNIPTAALLKCALSQLMPSLGLSSEPLPPWWTADLVKDSAHDSDKWILISLNCACVDIFPGLFPAYCTEKDASAEELAEATWLSDLMGQKALATLASPSKAVGRQAR